MNTINISKTEYKDILKRQTNMEKELDILKKIVIENDEKIIKNIKDVEIGDIVEVEMGNSIPVDGKVIKGVAMVNESSFTGESNPVKKTSGSVVFAGTAIEEGSTLRAVTFGLGLVATALTMSYLLWMLKRVFFGKTPEHLEKVKEGSWYMTAPMMVLAGFSIVVGIYPDIFYKTIIPYMNGVLGV